MTKRRLESTSTVAAVPLALTSAGIALSGAMLLGQFTSWPVFLLFATLCYRFLGYRFHLPAPSQWVKIALLCAGVVAVEVSNGTFAGVQPGLEILFVLVSLKLLETHRARDFQVLTILGYFLALCDLLFYQDLSHGLCIGFMVCLETAALVRFHQDEGIGNAIRTSFWIAMQAVPMIVLLYVFVPRLSTGIRLQFGPSAQANIGPPDRMDPGSIAALASQHGSAFWAAFPDGNIPAELDLYWRGLVLWRCDGLTWVRGGNLTPERRGAIFDGELIHQTIILQPHMGSCLYALDRPSSAVPGAIYEAGDSLHSQRPVSLPTLYEVYSQLRDRERSIPSDQLRMALQKPGRISPEVQALVQGWRQDGADDARVVRSAVGFFRGGKFTYSLTPGTYSEEGLDEFLFKRRIGFCEHYAAAFATLMRVAGIPSRVVLGFHGGDFTGVYINVRQSDAHAWCEVWLKNKGWLRIDPTSAIAPERITSGLESFLEKHGASADGGRPVSPAATEWRRFADGTRLMWDQLTYQWDLRVLNYDEGRQRGLISSIGLAAWRPDQFGLALILAGAVFVGGAMLWLAHVRRGSLDPAGRLYSRLCALLAARGVARHPWEGPIAFSQRAAEALPNCAEQIIAAGYTYALCRYGREGAHVKKLANWVRLVRKAR